MRYLIQINDVYYDFSPSSFNPKTNTYEPVATSRADIIKALEGSYLDDLSKIPLEHIQGEIKIISSSNENNILVNGTKTSRELIVAKGDLDLRSVSKIKFTDLIYSYNLDGNIKLAVSLDSGTTWNTLKEGALEKLNVTIPIKEHEEFSNMEQLIWNNARDHIYEKGFTPKELSLLGALIEHEDSIRFAYVLDRPSYKSIAETQQLITGLESRGYFVPVDEDKCDIEVFADNIQITSKEDLDMLKINVMYAVDTFKFK